MSEFNEEARQTVASFILAGKGEKCHYSRFEGEVFGSLEGY